MLGCQPGCQLACPDEGSGRREIPRYKSQCVPQVSRSPVRLSTKSLLTHRRSGAQLRRILWMRAQSLECALFAPNRTDRKRQKGRLSAYAPKDTAERRASMRGGRSVIDVASASSGQLSQPAFQSGAGARIRGSRATLPWEGRRRSLVRMRQASSDRSRRPPPTPAR